MCSCGCGQRRDVAWDGDTNGWWTAHEVVCEAGAALEAARKEKKEPEPGSMLYVALSDEYEAKRPTG
jgi:hypothetical protein